MPSALDLPSLDSAHDVPPEARAAYARDGHVLLRDVATADEVAAYAAVIAAAASSHHERPLPLAERDLYGKAFLQSMNLWTGSPEVARFVLSRRFAGIAAALLGVSRVRLYHDQALFKEAGGGITPWHQDAGYWPLDGERCVTMWLPLQDTTPDMGTLQFASGTNAVGALSDLVISQESEEHFASLLDGRFTVTEPGAFAMGDASFHGGWTVHRALPNTSSTVRAVMTVIWFADGALVTEAPDEQRRADLARWLPGCGPGERAASELNPVLP